MAWFVSLIIVLSAENKAQLLTAAAGWEAGTAWGATNPAWGLSVARAVERRNQLIKINKTHT